MPAEDTSANTTVLYEAAGGIARLTLNRAEKRNALNDELIAALKESITRAGKDEAVSTILIAAAGADFCSGADLSALQKISTASVEENLADARSLMELLILIRSTRQPVIAAVKGRALAGGCGLASACDIVLAARSARFGYPEVKIGFVPAMVMAILRRNVSEKVAFEMIVRGETFTAERAAETGLVTRVLDDTGFEDAVREYMRGLTATSASAVALSKYLLYQIDGM